jgi:hypothetical protein
MTLRKCVPDLAAAEIKSDQSCHRRAYSNLDAGQQSGAVVAAAVVAPRICADACGANDQLTNATPLQVRGPAAWLIRLASAEVSIDPRGNDPADTQWNTKPWS